MGRKNYLCYYHMTKKYKQLTLEQRYKIEALVCAGKSQTQIAKILGVHKSTVCRELNRNTPKRGIGAKNYVARNADIKAQNRHKCKHKAIKYTSQMKLQTMDLMQTEKYSPELVAAQWKKDGSKGVSYETIYKFVWECKHSNKICNSKFKHLYKHLKHGRRKRKRGNYKDSRGLIPNRVSIEKRPKIVEKRKRFGDIEVDLIVGANHKSALLITIDRATLKTTIDKITSKNARLVSKKIISRMKHYPPIKTITFDNDQAFSEHETIAKTMDIKTYFTRPYTSQDKGSIENRNGVIRRFFPKKTDFTQVTNTEIKRVENQINNRPVRKFNYLTPNEVFLNLNGSVALIS
jgi:IS30 family transposase